MTSSPHSSTVRAGRLLTSAPSGVQLPLRRPEPAQTPDGADRDPWFTALIVGIAVGFVFLGVCSLVGMT